MNIVMLSLVKKPFIIETSIRKSLRLFKKTKLIHCGFIMGKGFLVMMVMCFFGYNSLLAQTTPLKFEVDGNLRTTEKLFVGIPTSDDGSLPDLVGLNYSLYVNGTAMATKLVIKKHDDWLLWPDYVFDSGYNLMPLPALRDYVSLHKHLPNVPSAAEVEKDGIDVARTQAALLHKIEELTLYALRQQAEIDKRKSVEEALQMKLNNLEQLVRQLLGEKNK